MLNNIGRIYMDVVSGQPIYMFQYISLYIILLWMHVSRHLDPPPNNFHNIYDFYCAWVTYADKPFQSETSNLHRRLYRYSRNIFEQPDQVIPPFLISIPDLLWSIKWTHLCGSTAYRLAIFSIERRVSFRNCSWRIWYGWFHFWLAQYGDSQPWRNRCIEWNRGISLRRRSFLECSNYAQIIEFLVDNNNDLRSGPNSKCTSGTKEIRRNVERWRRKNSITVKFEHGWRVFAGIQYS